ncbi:MAG: DUF3182 family protein [Rubrivivax sp.]|nr:DUF3182 family protein [Rubrivivax sp.]
MLTSAYATLMSLEDLEGQRPGRAPLAPRRRALGFYRCGAGSLQGHDLATRVEVARQLALVLGCRFSGGVVSAAELPEGAYVVPSDTLTSIEEARRLGITGPEDLFGGVVPHPFVATKLVTHPLVSRRAAAPAHWVHELGHELGASVLPGYSVFGRDDAIEAACRLLPAGPVRLKDAGGVGGAGQWVAATLHELTARLDTLGPDRLAGGFVVERNLARVQTCSVGQVRAGRWLATYAGHQRLVRNHRGHEVYGGSTLSVVEGDFDELARLDLSPQMRLAIEQARQYHRTVHEAFPQMIASRCNYDVAQGHDTAGRWVSGVLEQSWRIGGCSGAEVAALRAFKERGAHAVQASTHEVYGDVALPPGAVVLFDGHDAQAGGRIVKYALVHAHVDA